MLQQLANASKDVDASIDDFNRQAAHYQKAVRDTFCHKAVELAERLQTVLQQEAVTTSIYVDEATRDAATSLQGNFAQC